MPLKRKAVQEEDIGFYSGSEDDESSVDLGSPARSKSRRLKERETGARASPTPTSPALNTRRSSRLSAQTEPQSKHQNQPTEPQPRTRLKRGLRRGSQVSNSAPSRGGGGRGSRGRRGRGRPPKSSSGQNSSAAKKPRNSTSLGDSSSGLSSESDADSESTGDYDAEERDSEGQLSGGETEDSASASVGDEDKDDASQMESNAGEEVEEGDEDDNDSTDNKEAILSTSEGEQNEEQQDEEDEEEESGGNDDMQKEKDGSDTAGTTKKGKRGRGPGRPKAVPLVSEDSDNNADEGDGLEMEDPDNDDFSDADGGFEAPLQTSLTRRQRAKLTRDYDEELLELPVESKRSKFSAEEAALRKSEHARRRKFQSMQRAEQLKNDTINRLLNKQTSKGRNKVSDDVETRATSVDDDDETPDRIRYTQRIMTSPAKHGSSGKDKKEPTASNSIPGASAHVECALSLPTGMALDTLLPCATPKGFVPKYPSPSPTCSVEGCSQKKKYSVNAQAACSLEHWRLLSTAVVSESK
ncbi:INO80 complex subunit B [Coemansia sp. RSA 1939]|nr:INO80 complex subunit B [Coemansia sp. RSA 1939]KAJ2596905.1 INO80 complex subunit B [Coemansia sp. RSA 1804]KAJ2678440.1 INO80 complex subunit B [Coemansia sp. RSA 1285]